MRERRSTNKVGLIGTGMVGASFAYSLMQRGLANELVLIDMDTARAEGEAMDLNHGLPFVGPMRISAGDYPDLADAELVVICAGANQRPGETRLGAAVFGVQPLIAVPGHRAREWRVWRDELGFGQDSAPVLRQPDQVVAVDTEPVQEDHQLLWRAASGGRARRPGKREHHRALCWNEAIGRYSAAEALVVPKCG